MEDTKMLSMREMINLNIAAFIGKLKREHNQPFRELAENIGIGNASLWSYYKLKSEPGIRAAMKIAKFGNISIDDLMYGRMLNSSERYDIKKSKKESEEKICQ